MLPASFPTTLPGLPCVCFGTATDRAFFATRAAALRPTSNSACFAFSDGAFSASSISAPDRGKFVEALLRNVKLGDWDAAQRAAIEVISKTDSARRNETFKSILEYLDCQNDDLLCSGREFLRQFVPKSGSGKCLAGVATNTSWQAVEPPATQRR